MNRSILEVPQIPSDFGFTEEHELARAEARRFLSERCTINEVRRLTTDMAGFDRALFREMAGMGWLGLTVKEAWSGLALDALHQALLLEEMGRVLLPSPYFGSLLAVTAIVQAGSASQCADLLPPIVKGERVATLALLEPNASWDPAEVTTTAEPAADGFVLRGTKTHVLFGNAADLVIVPCREPTGHIAFFAVDLPTPSATMTAETPLDSTRRMARLVLEGARVGRAARLEQEDPAALSRTHLAGAALLAAEMTGGIERVLGLTRDYATTRMQFGRPIGAFQAVKHPIVDVMLGCEQARSLALGAAVALDQDPASVEVLSRSAKAYASDVYVFAAKKGVQLHGGFGFTWDCDVHFYFKRALWSRGTLGDGVFHRRQLARTILG